MSISTESRVASNAARHKRISSMRPILSAAMLLLVMSACGDDKSSGDSSSSASLAGTSWTLANVSIADKSVASVAVATLAFDKNGTGVTGSTGCNRFAGGYTQTGSDLKITLGPVTLAACTDPATTAQETAILAQLPKVASFSDDTQLVLKDSSGKTLLTYDKGLASLEGTSWTATGINNGKGAVESTTSTETVTADFATGGAISGNSGCNTYNGTYTTSGTDGIAVTGVATTRKACEESLMTLETQYLAALEAATNYEISGNTLTLRNSSGTQVTYTLKS
jgi:heat shock protein HslJ